ncbi:hypothetical protein [Bdellovibrio reynosensis]|uniref:Uncharacterized protein n=1 Tax=Bdellovibrio reynosensis TaxID=2835041 RepID=A0ABY4C7W8_9BACT|nr:hypothetical protein [Bdellovibrio reynosensis]UOF01025.1 hypothetical protein MNR06_15095 [Bdellovibrio reynosensis]
METYRPAAPPAWKKFFGNPLVQLSLLAVVAGGVSITLYQKGQQSLERRVSYLKSTVQINQGAQNLPPAEVSELEELPTATDQASQKPDSDASDGTITATKVTAAGSPTADKSDTAALSAAATPGKEGRAVAKTTGPRLVVYYAEVGRGTLNRIVNDSRSTGQYMNFNDYSAGILPNISRSITSPQILILHKEERTVDNSKTLQWSYGLKDRRDPSVEIGLTTFFEINEMEGNNLRGNMEIQRTWREMGSSGGFEIQRKSFPAIFEIGNDSGFFMAGVMPTQSNLENEQELTAIDIFKILRSPRFRDGNSEFVIFVEFAKGN